VVLSSSTIFILHNNFSSVFITKVDALHRFCVFTIAIRWKTGMAGAGPMRANIRCPRAFCSLAPQPKSGLPDFGTKHVEIGYSRFGLRGEGGGKGGGAPPQAGRGEAAQFSPLILARRGTGPAMRFGRSRLVFSAPHPWCQDRTGPSSWPCRHRRGRRAFR
jgi:hypothetical protein